MRILYCSGRNRSKAKFLTPEFDRRGVRWWAWSRIAFEKRGVLKGDFAPRHSMDYRLRPTNGIRRQTGSARYEAWIAVRCA